MDAPNLTPPPGNPRFALMDSLRALAALAVFAGHTYTGQYRFAAHPGLFLLAVHVADEGVAVFFLLSGFLLYRPFIVARRAGRRYPLGDYAARRVLRIVPAYWAALTIVIALGFVDGVDSGNWSVFYGFGQIYSPHLIGQGIGVAWTLCIEVTFYAALPVYAAVAGRLAARRGGVRAEAILLTLLAAASLAYRAHYANLLQTAEISRLPGYGLWFALGMGLALASVGARGPAPAPRHWPALSWLAAGIVFAAAHESPHTASLLGATGAALLLHVLYGLAAVCLLAPAVFEHGAGGPVRALLRHPALAWLGMVSYGFYLYHTIVIAQLTRFAAGHGIAPRYPLVALASLAVSAACASISFHLLERPLMALARRRSGPRPPARRPRELRA
jgi:peptidoglycan/LPS O-acetylase OafA/YrhL